MKKIAIINYGMGNLRSVENAVKRLNFDPKIVSSPKQLDNYDKIILPGVGSFKKAMKLLKENNWINSININIKDKKKYLFGICLGMQLLASESEEFGITKGLGLIKGKIKFLGNLGCKLKIPQIGWNSIFIKKEHKFLKGVTNNMDFYFVNSYAFVPEEKSFEIAKTNYDIDFCSIISKENIFGAQFHPEKSSKAGRKILENFLNA
tara:strand:+ start:60 stop:677 length:618 start_codon:yes stop_codon:yes gene_type:complete